MARTTAVDVGAAANDGTGDTNRSAFQTVNTLIGDAVSQSDTTTQNIASDVDFAAGKGVFYNSVDYVPVSGSSTTTATPRTSGSITLSIDDLANHKTGPEVLVTGMIQIGSVSSPVGLDGFDIELPFSVADLTGSGGRFSCSCTKITGGVPTLLSARGFENDNIIRVYIDASTLAAGDQFWLSISYFTEA